CPDLSPRPLVRRFETLEIDAVWYDLDRPSLFIKTCFLRFGKQYFTSLFSKNNKAVRFIKQPRLDPLCRAIKPPALRPDARIGVLLGEKAPYIKKQFRLML